jgi:hypothetical protein
MRTPSSLLLTSVFYWWLVLQSASPALNLQIQSLHLKKELSNAQVVMHHFHHFHHRRITIFQLCLIASRST